MNNYKININGINKKRWGNYYDKKCQEKLFYWNLKNA